VKVSAGGPPTIRVRDILGAMVAVAVAMVVTVLAALASPVVAYVMWRNDRKRAAR
jgi:hypothetical protein